MTPKIEAAVFEDVSLATLLAGIVMVDPVWDRQVMGVAVDDRKVQPDFLFIAQVGERFDAREKIGDAIARGAIAVIAESELESKPVEVINHKTPVFYCHGLQGFVGRIVSRFVGHPSRRLDIIGVTGTAGKTSTTQFIAQAFTYLKKPCAVMGTMGYGLLGQLEGLGLTTPEPCTINYFLADCLYSHVPYVAMEVSSHALDQSRVKSIEFKTAVFTNLTQDHLDYHLTMEAYGKTKQKLFQQFGLKHALVNVDDPYSQTLLPTIPKLVKTYTYGLSSNADIKASDVRFELDGIVAQIQLPFGKGELRTPLWGIANLSNVLAVLGVLCVHGVKFKEALDAISKLKGVNGRMQCIRKGEVLCIIDYSHKPQALENALLSLKHHCKGDLWCIFGCGGDRDKTKRPLMASVAEKYADKVIVTDDNPRFELSEMIIADILKGISDLSRVYVESDRKKAITYALKHAKPQDVILIAGKGNETYQIIGDQHLPFSDEAVVLAW